MSKYGESQLRLLQHARLAAVIINNTEHGDNCNICWNPQYHWNYDQQIFDMIISSVCSLWILIKCTFDTGIMSELKNHYWNYNINKMWNERLITSVCQMLYSECLEYLWTVPVKWWMLWTHWTSEKYNIGIYWIIQYDTDVF